MKEEKLLPVGTKVFDIRYGWGEVKEYKDGGFPITAKMNGTYCYYTKDGYGYSATNRVPILSLTEYTLENGGFTPISEYWTKPKIGDWGYFWDNGIYNGVFFGRLASIETRSFGAENAGRWQNFSHDIPDHIKKQMQQ